MADTTEVKLDSEHRVALDLAYRIAQAEDIEPKNREYWLHLYQNCRRFVVGGATAARALEE